MAWGSYASLSLVAPTLEGTVLVTGHPGDDIWSMHDRAILPHFLAPGDRLLEGSSLAEFRLRVGFFWFPAAWIAAYHKEAIHRVTTAAEMRPWSVRGSYNRPIPRRIAEESGVPRSLFGQCKLMGLSCWLNSPDAMSSAGWHDFQTFCEARLKNRRRGNSLINVAAAADELLFRGLQRMPNRLYLAGMPLALSGLRDHRTVLWKSAFLYTFHWGTEYIRSRYVM
jgi:hypothetical protein